MCTLHGDIECEQKNKKIFWFQGKRERNPKYKKAPG